MSKPSRLYRRLKPSSSLFRIYSTTTDELELDDDMIQSIDIHRGSSTPDSGPNPHTIEVNSNEFHYGRTTGNQITCELTGYGRSLIASKIGASATRISTRFAGRVGKVNTDDVGGRWIYGKKTVILGASAHAQLSLIDEDMTDGAGLNVAHSLQRRFAMRGLGQPISSMLPVAHYAPPYLDQYGVLNEETTFNGFDDAMSKLAAATGIYIQTRRDGALYFVTHQARWDSAVAANSDGTSVPIGRHQAISPALWEQPSETIPRAHRSMWTNAAGKLETIVLGLDDTAPNLPIVNHDMTAIRFADDSQPVREAHAHWYREQAVYYRVRSLTIDLLRLIDSDSEYDHKLATMLLEMEVGEAVYLSGDWVYDLRGIHFAVGIEESITPDGWTIVLNITNSAEVVGLYGVDPQPRVWKQFANEWDEETEKWR